MPSTFTSRLRVERPATGEQTGVWGNTVNQAAFDLIDEAVYGVGNIAMTDADLILTVPNGLPSTARSFTYSFSGTLTAARTVTLPGIERRFEVENLTGQTLNFIAPARTGTVSVPPTGLRVMICGATTLREVNRFLPDGTAAVPGLGFALDPDTGIYRPNTNSFGIAIGGVPGATFSPAGISFKFIAEVSAPNASFSLNKAASGERSVVFGAKGGLARWAIELGTSEAESVGNAGSNFRIGSYTDAGASLTNVVNINRATGNATFSGAISAGAAVSAINSINLTGANPSIEVGGTVTASLDLKVAAADDFDVRLTTSGVGGSLTSASNLSIVSGGGQSINYSSGSGFHSFADETLLAGEYFFTEGLNDTGFLSGGDGIISVKTNGIVRGSWLADGRFTNTADIVTNGKAFVGDGTTYLAQDILNFIPNWFFGFNRTNGDLYWQTPSGDQWFIRAGDGWNFNSRGPLAGVGAYVNLSDVRTKRNIEPLSYGLGSILNLMPVRFQRIENDAYDIGFVAQEVRGVIPEAVSVANFGPVQAAEGEEPILGLAAETLIPVLVNAIKELAARVAALEAAP